MRGYHVILPFFICILCLVNAAPTYLNDPIKPFDEQNGRTAAHQLAYAIVDELRQVRKSGRGFGLTSSYTLENCGNALRREQGKSALRAMKQADTTLLYVLPVFYEELSNEIESFFKNELHMNALQKDTPEMNHQITVNTECIKPALMDLRI